ncbi:regulator of nucleoside diphosphate kinase [Pseudochelatococcus lubricantis]|uniref:Regulator of nucleoside diphosphate kinase n=1 Tax=Pseudochelatococcus lubricantis TaxID=1538102 RepID=A0ABX0UXB2_9HYPH|nr:nucleoside diphosphate kinase regulator [Pseudochelatococcus lubricantis]NIJ56525.1 regulator of nucleoside diphosphate kinase [Pseudochelatococcus lubricantis]
MTKSGTRLPRIVVSEEEQERLSALAASISARNPELAEELQGEMERARVVRPDKMPAGVVRMNSRVEFESDDGQRRRVTLVYPGEADISAGRISILTPIGTALIGLSEGQSINWTARDGREQRLTVLSVDNGGESAPEEGVVDLAGARAARRQDASAAGDDDPGPSAA